MNNVLAVYVFHRRDQLRVESGSHSLGKPTLANRVLLILLNVVEELTLLNVLHDQIDLTGRLNDLVDADDMGVTQLLENVDFLDYAAQLAGSFHTFLLENFDGHLCHNFDYIFFS